MLLSEREKAKINTFTVCPTLWNSETVVQCRVLAQFSLSYKGIYNLNIDVEQKFNEKYTRDKSSLYWEQSFSMLCRYDKWRPINSCHIMLSHCQKFEKMVGQNGFQIWISNDDDMSKKLEKN